MNEVQNSTKTQSVIDAEVYAHENVAEHIEAYSAQRAKQLLLQVGEGHINFIATRLGGDGSQAPEMYAAALIYINAANDIEIPECTHERRYWLHQYIQLPTEDNPNIARISNATCEACGHTWVHTESTTR